MMRVEQLVEDIKKNYPDSYGQMDDSDVYEMVRKKRPDLTWPEINPYEQKSDINLNNSNDLLDASKVKDEDSSPGTFSNLALAGLPEIWADKHDWAARAYNNSMAGLAYKMAYGKPKYDVEEYSSGVMEDVGGFFLGLASIPDLALFLGTGGLGSKVLAPKVMGSKTVQGLFKQGMAEGAERQVRNSAFRGKLIAQGALESGFGLGTYGAAGGALAEAARQSTEGEEFNYGKIFGESIKAGLSGAIIGSASGGVGKGIMSPKFARAKMAQKAGDVSTKNLATRILNNPGSQVLAEAGIFTTGQLTEQSLLHDQDVSMDDFWRSMGTNIGIIGGMRAVFKPLRRNENDVTRYRKARNDFLGRDNKKILESLESVETQLKEAGVQVPSELRDNLVASNLKNKKERAAFDWIAKNEEKYKKLTSKDFKNLPEAEKIQFIQNSNLVNTLRMGIYRKVLKSRELREYMLEAEIGRKPTNAELKAYKNKIEGRINEHVRIKKFMNEVALGDKNGAKRTRAQIEMENRKIELADLKLKTLKEQSTWVNNEINKLKQDIKFENELSKPDKNRLNQYEKQLSEIINIKESVDAQLPAAKQARANIELDKIPSAKKTKQPDLNIYGQEIKPGERIKVPADKSSVVLDKKKKGFTATNSTGDKVGTFKNKNIAKQANDVFKTEKPSKKFNDLNKAGYVSTPETVKQIANWANKKFNRAVSHLNLSASEKKQLRNAISEQAGIQKKVFTKKLNPNEVVKNANDLAKFVEALERSNIETIQRRKNIVDYFKTTKEIEGYEKAQKISKKQQQDNLKELGVKDGDIAKATNEQLQNYKNKLYEVETISKDPIRLAAEESVKITLPTTAWGKAKLSALKSVGQFVDVVEFVAGERFANKLKKHVSVESKLFGDNFLIYQADAINGYVRADGKKISGVGEKIYKRDSDSIHILHDKGQKYLESKRWLKERGLSKSQRKELEADVAFFEKAVNVKEWMKTVDKDGKFGEGLNASVNGVLKYANFNTEQGRIYGRYADPKIGIPISFKNALYRSVKANMTEAQFTKWKMDNKINWIEKGLYITNVVTPEFKRSANLNSLGFEKILKKETNVLAKQLASKKYKTKKPTADQVAEFHNMAREHAISNIIGSNDFSPSTMKNKFLIERQSNLPLFIKDNAGNLIRTFERSHDNTVKRYAVGMSKHIAGMEIFPEYVKMSGTNSPGVKIEIAELNLMKGGGNMKQFITEGVEQYLGINQRPSHSMIVKSAETMARFLAKTQLSMPTSGIKNTFLGNIQNLWAYNMLDIAKGYSEIMRKEHTRALIRGGHTELGTNIYEGSARTRAGRALERGSEKLFSIGGMKPTEQFMRNLTVLTSKSDQSRNIDLMRNNPKGSKAYEKGFNRLKNFYEASSADIKLLAKYGFEPPKDKMGNYVLEGFKGSTFEKMKTSRLLENAHQYLDTMSHVKTQGSSISLFMPKIASHKAVKPLTLFKRMAYAATVNTGKNVKESVQSGNYLRLATGTLGTYFGGQALLGMYSYLLGSPIPKENSGWFDNFKTALWRGEFLGILSDIWSPFEGRQQSMYPSIIQTGEVIGKNLFEAATDKREFWGKGLQPDKNTAFDQILRKTITVYNGATKAIEARVNPYSIESNKFRSLYRDFEAEFDPDKVTPEFEATKKSPYYNMLRNAFEKGNSKEFAEAFVLTYYALASDIYNKGYDMDGVRVTSLNDAFKSANGTLKRKMRSFDPTRTPAPGAKTATKMKYLKWIKWLKKNEEKGYMDRFRSINLSYQKRLAEIKSQLPHFIRTNNLKDLHKEFVWI